MAREGLHAAALRCLRLDDPAAKCAAVAAVHAACEGGALKPDPELPVEPVDSPGRPARPVLVEPSAVARRRLGSREGQVALIHAIAHIEFNAINLALDAAYRFRGLPPAYYEDWLSVAADEARHFRLLQERLAAHGAAYGDLPAHNGLWEMAEATADSCLVRMALVPRVLEARGLDVTPGMIARLQEVGDAATADVLGLILREEVRHVEIGTRWFRFCCAQEDLEPVPTFLGLLETRYKGQVRGPFNIEARLLAGFTEEELTALGHGPQADPGGIQSATGRTVSGVTSR